eukprot:5024530-Alexandrium_andersonii.AAC.1
MAEGEAPARVVGVSPNANGRWTMELMEEVVASLQAFFNDEGKGVPLPEDFDLCGATRWITHCPIHVVEIHRMLHQPLARVPP